MKVNLNDQVLLPNQVTKKSVDAFKLKNFISLYLADDADYSCAKILEYIGELNVNTTKW